MRKFKHIPTGDIYTQPSDTDKRVFLNDIAIPLKIVTGKDWEEIAKPIYTILFFEKCGGLYPNDGKENYLLRGDFSIHAIRRENDGTIFTIGCKYTHYCSPQKIVTLKKFYIAGEFIFLNSTSESRFESRIDNVSLVEKVLTTEDEVDKYIGDIVVCVNVSNTPRLANRNYPVDITTMEDGDYKYFHSFNKAEEFVLLNTKCLSVNDILTYCGATAVDVGTFFLSKVNLKELAKSKL